MIRCLHVLAGRSFGGIETSMVRLHGVQHEDDRVRHEFAVCFEGRLASELGARSASVRVIGSVRLRNRARVRRARRSLADLVADREVDCVIYHSAWTAAVFGDMSSRSGVAEIFYLHDVIGDHRRALLRAAPRFTAMLANSRFTKEQLEQHTGRPHIPIVHEFGPQWNEPRTDSQRERRRASIGTDERTVVVLHASRMQAWKGHNDLISALELVRTETPWECWFVGGAQGPRELSYEAALRRRIERSPLSGRCRFLGQRSDMSELYGAADIFCQPNPVPEPFGLVFVEALASGLPVVATDIGGATEIVDPSCGCLVPPRDPNALALALTSLIDDADQRRQLGLAGPSRAVELSDPVRLVRQLNDCVVEVVQRSPRGQRV